MWIFDRLHSETWLITMCSSLALVIPRCWLTKRGAQNSWNRLGLELYIGTTYSPHLRGKIHCLFSGKNIILFAKQQYCHQILFEEAFFSIWCTKSPNFYLIFEDTESETLGLVSKGSVYWHILYNLLWIVTFIWLLIKKSWGLINKHPGNVFLH